MNLRAHDRYWAPLLVALVFICCQGCFVFPRGESFPGRDRSSVKYATVVSADTSPVEQLMALEFSGQRFSGVFLATLAGKVTSCVCSEEGGQWCGAPAFSPDGKDVVFSRGIKNKSANLFLARRDGGGLRRLTASQALDLNPVFSEDGRRVYFIRQGTPEEGEGIGKVLGDIVYIDLGDGSEHQVTAERFQDLAGLRLLPGGRFAAFTTKSPALTSQGHTLWQMDLRDPGKKMPILPDLRGLSTLLAKSSRESMALFDLQSPVLSRDGRYLAFAWRNPDIPRSEKGPQVLVANLGTGTTKNLTEFREGAAPTAMTSDGQMILIVTQELNKDYGDEVLPHTNLWRVQRDGTGLRNIPLDFRGLAGQAGQDAPAPNK